MIPTRALGSTGIVVPRLGLGTVKWGRNLGLKFPRRDALPDLSTIERLLEIALQHGVTLLDTAPAYGEAETIIGRLIDGDRRFVVATKAGEEFEPEPPDGASVFDFSGASMIRSVESSCRRLRRETLDIVTIHADGRPFDEIVAAGAIDALRQMKADGIIRAIGYSAKGSTDAEQAIGAVDILMCTIHRGYEEEVDVVAKAEQRGVGVIIKKAMASGRATNPNDLAAVARRPGVTTVLTSTIDPSHLSANIEAFGR